MFSKMALYTSSLYTLSTSPKLESSLKIFGLCLCHRAKNLLALEDFVHFHNPKKICSVVSFSLRSKC